MKEHFYHGCMVTKKTSIKFRLKHPQKRVNSWKKTVDKARQVLHATVNETSH
jgi:hypothetical protein